MAVIEAIETVYLEADQASVTFDALGSYEHLQLRMMLRSTNTVSQYMLGEMRFGDTDGIDSTGNYAHQYMSATGTSEGGAGGTGFDAARFYTGALNNYNVGAGFYGEVVIDILDYQSTTKNVVYQYVGTSMASTGSQFMVMGTGSWDKPTLGNPMTQFYIQNSSGNHIRGSSFTLYGLNSAN